MVALAELLTSVEVIFALLLGHVTSAKFCALHHVVWVLERLLNDFGVLAEAITHRRVAGLLSRVSRWESQVLSKFEVHVWTAV